jgi:penicillin-binding protein 1B
MRQPGSLFKPIIYVAAFEAERRGDPGWLTPAALVNDEPIAITMPDGIWTPENMVGRFHGPVTVRRALEESLNVPAVIAAQDVGLPEVIRAAHALGVQSRLIAVPSLALGTSELSLLEITVAFATLANGGVRVHPTTLDLESGPAAARAVTPLPPPVQAVSAESAFMMTHLLRGVMQRGTGASSARWGLSEITAGKTGTTEGLRDAWFVGYTPDLVIGVWVGADDGRPVGVTGAQTALPIWANVMRAAVRRARPSAFEPPPGIVMVPVDRTTGHPAYGWCETEPVAPISEAFRVGSQPEPICAETPPAQPWDLPPGPG